MGRTGALFSYMQKGIVPDILTSAKGLGGGFPIGAMLTTNDIASVFTPGVHGTTYGGNPLACAVAGAVFDVINTTEVLDGVKARHALFMEGLKAINARRRVFADLRGEGVWLGCELDAPYAGKAPDVLRAAGEQGLLVLMAGPNVVRIAPSLTISLDEILEGLARLEAALTAPSRNALVLRPPDRARRPAGGPRALGAHRQRPHHAARQPRAPRRAHRPLARLVRRERRPRRRLVHVRAGRRCDRPGERDQRDRRGRGPQGALVQLPRRHARARLLRARRLHRGAHAVPGQRPHRPHRARVAVRRPRAPPRRATGR